MLEWLEARVVPSLADGTLLVATGPSSFSTQDQSSFATGIVAVNPSTGAQSLLTQGGLFSQPTYIWETPDQQLYVTDLDAFGTGAIIRVDPNTGNQFLVAKGGFLNGPNALAFVNGYLYVANEADGSGLVHTIVQVDPNTGGQTLITDGNKGTGFTVPTGLAPGPGNTVYVSDEPGGYNGTDPGGIWKVDLTTGVQTQITHGGNIVHPVDMALDANGNMVTIGATSPTDYSGTIVRTDANTGTQTVVAQNVASQNGIVYGGDSIVVDAPYGRIYIGAISYGTTPAQILAIDPASGSQGTLTSGNLMSLVEGIRVYRAVVQTAATTTRVTSSLNPSAAGANVTVTATVMAQNAGSATPTGTVQFQIDGSNFGSPTTVTSVGSGQATASLTISTLAVGTHTVTATYGGDANFSGSTGSLSGGQVVTAVNNAGGNVAVTFNANSGMLTINGDTANNAITLKLSSGLLQVAGVGTLINQSASPVTFDLSALTEIDIVLLNGSDSVTMNGFAIPGILSIIAGTGALNLSLDTITAAVIHISAPGSLDTVSLTNAAAGSVSVSTGDSATISVSGVKSSDLVSLLAGSNSTVSANGVTAGGDLDVTVGDNAQSVAVKGSSSYSINILQTGKAGSPSFDLENDAVKNNLNFNAGDGNNKVILSRVTVGAELLVFLGAGNNTVTADHVTAFFGMIDGGTGLNNQYMDGGGNAGYSVFGFMGQ
jgi:hypothetical protein